MGKVAISAAAGIVVAGILLAAMYLGIQLPPTLLMSVAAALSVGAATAVLTRYALDRPKEKPRGNELLGKRIRDIKDLITAFPKGSSTVRLSVKGDTAIDELEVVKHAADYASRQIIVELRDSAKRPFNPVNLKKLFLVLKDQPGFHHLLLFDRKDEFLGYVPGIRAKDKFTGPDGEQQIVDYIVRLFEHYTEDPEETGRPREGLPPDLRKIDGLADTDTISDDTKLSDAQSRMEGGFHRLIVLHRGRHRKPVGLLFSEQLLAMTKPPRA